MTLAVLVLLALAGVTALVATNLRVFRPAPAAPAAPARLVSVLIPARNEAATIQAAVRAACGQPGVAEVIVLDDGSTDDTGAILHRLAATEPSLRVVTGEPLPAGWAGKSWACWQLASRHARTPWILFVDADVRLARGAAARLLAEARRQDVAFLSGFPRQVTGTAGEALVVPLIHLVLLAYLPMRLVRRSPVAALSAGCGQLMLVSRAAYLAAGGHAAVRDTLHDGIKLARRLKAAGASVGLVDATDLAACRMYEGLAATWRGFARNAYEALGSPAALATMVVLNGTLFVLPFVALPATLLAQGATSTAAVWASGVTLVVGLRLVLARRFRAPAWTAVATPLAVLLMLGIQLHSFANHCLGRPVVWRARAYRPSAAGERS
jgi:hypothetical protein